MRKVIWLKVFATVIEFSSFLNAGYIPGPYQLYKSVVKRSDGGAFYTEESYF
jgi:hypothetical protein